MPARSRRTISALIGRGRIVCRMAAPGKLFASINSYDALSDPALRFDSSPAAPRRCYDRRRRRRVMGGRALRVERRQARALAELIGPSRPRGAYGFLLGDVQGLRVRDVVTAREPVGRASTWISQPAL